MTTSPPKNLSDLNNIHKELDDLFFRHQVAVLKADGREARASLQTYAEGLRSHLKEEEEILLPLYRERATPIRGGDPETFTQEHQKINEWLGRLKLRLSRLNFIPDPKDIISVMDDEAHYKKFIEHHSLREERILYPELDRVISDQEKSALCRLLSFSMDSFEKDAKPKKEIGI